MKNAVFFAAIVLMVLLSGSGCQKEISFETLSDTTNRVTISLLRKITVHHPSSSDPFNAVISLQYDMAAKKINVYLDDTTTSNPFDLLALTYQFDLNGYLTGATALDDNNNFRPDFSIIRNGNGQMQKLIEFGAEQINGVPYNDTVYYSYQQVAGQTTVKDSVHFYGATGFYTRRTTYNVQDKPISSAYSSGPYSNGTENYSYNSTGTVASVTNDYDTTEFSYDNTPVNIAWQDLPRIFLGKDYYILQQPPLTSRLSYSFLSFIIEPEFETVYNPLLTHPVSKIVRHGFTINNRSNATSKTMDFVTTYTADKFPLSISVLPVGEDPFYYTFEYQ